MPAVRVNGFGGPEVFTLTEVDRPAQPLPKSSSRSPSQESATWMCTKAPARPPLSRLT
jgi:hypothetical protein